jgi:hypothetical protein
MKYTKNQEKVNRRCEKLRELGFILEGEEQAVINLTFFINSTVHVKDIRIDFSAIDDNMFMQHAWNKIYLAGASYGKNYVRKEINNILKMDEED